MQSERKGESLREREEREKEREKIKARHFSAVKIVSRTFDCVLIYISIRFLSIQYLNSKA